MEDHKLSKYWILSLCLRFSLIIFPLDTALTAQPAGADQLSGTATEKYTGPIIDMHLHSYSDDFWGPGPSPASGKMSPSNSREQMEQTFEVMKEYNIVLGAVSGISSSSGNDWYTNDRDRTFRGIELREPSKFMSPDSLRQLIRERQVDMLGEVGAQYFGYSPSDPQYYPYYKIAEEEGIPVGIHTGASFPGTPYRCCPKFRLKMGNPLLLEDMLVEFPKLKVIMMHAGGAGPFSDYSLQMMNMYPRLYTDLSVINWMPGMEPVLENFLKQAKQMKLLDRVLYGTDQMIWPETIGRAVERINSLDFLSVEEKADIFYNNAARFLELTEEEIARHKEMAASQK